MSDPQVPPGWYPDGTTNGVLRWWDGVAWTEATTAATGATSASAADGRPTGTVFAYLVAVVWLLPIVAELTVPFGTSLSSDFGSSAGGRMSNLLPAELGLLTSPGYLLTIVLGWVSTALVVVFAALDRRALLARGVVKPFSWAWTLFGLISGWIGPGIYLIGRTVTLGRLGRRLRGPLVVWIVAVALSAVVGVVIAVEVLQALQPLLANTVNAN